LALRVLKPGGTFVLQDLFLLRSIYGTPEELVNTVRGWDVSEVSFIRTCDEAFIPAFVNAESEDICGNNRGFL